MSGLIVVAIGILLFSLVSGRLQDSVITPPLTFAVFGAVIGAGGLHLVTMPVTHGAIHILAEVTLVLVLFSDAARIDLRLLVRDHNLPQRLLLIGMPLTIVVGTLVGLMLPLGLGLWEAALLATVLAPTDAALGQSVVSDRNVPVRIRQAINVESGLNDGIAVPFVFLFAALVTGHEDRTDPSAVLSFTALQLVLGPIAGIVVGAGAGALIKAASERGWMTESFEGPAVLATAGLAYVLAIAIGGNGFIAAFVAGLMFGYTIAGHCKFLLGFAESEGQVLVFLSFIVFGAAMLPEVADRVNWWVVVYAILSLTVVRMLPVAIALIGTGAHPATVLFLGWFGPRGLASILFALLVLEEMSAAAGTIQVTAIVTVALSIAAHGVSAAPLARAYARFVQGRDMDLERKPVSEIPLRHGWPHLHAPR